MPRNKTRTEKIRLAEARQSHFTKATLDTQGQAATYTIPTVNLVTSKKKTESIADFFNYDITLLYKDVTKTIGIAALFVIALIGISIGLR